MKWKSLRTAAVCLAAGVWTWMLLSMKPDPVNRRRAAYILERMVPPAPVPVVWPETKNSSEFRTLALARTRSWLDARGRDAAGLIAVWDLTHDEALLKEAAERFPDHPLVCLVMISNAPPARPQDALPWVERLLAAEPKNPQGHFLKAWALSGDTSISRQGVPYFRYTNRDGVIAALRQAAALGGVRDAHGRERALAVYEAAVAAGMSMRDAATLCTGGRMANTPAGDPLDRIGSTTVWSGIARFFRDSIQEAREEGDGAKLVVLAELGLTGARAACRAAAPANITDTSRALRIQQELMNELPGDLKLSDGRNAVEAVKAELYLGNSVGDALHGLYYAQRRYQKANDEIVLEFNRVFLEAGESKAMMWIMDQPASAWTEPLWENNLTRRAAAERVP